MKECIVVGAGFWGATIARLLAESGHNVILVDKRNHLAGNCYDEVDDETKIISHVYGSHIFHTSDENVWNFLNRFTTFNDYHHKVLTQHDGKTYFMPFNLSLINQFFDVDLSPEEIDSFMFNTIGKDYIANPKNFEEAAISCIGRRLYEAFIKGYTEKQWNCDAKDLDASIFKRLVIRKNYNIDYFSDIHQGIPTLGYTECVKKILDHKNIDVSLGIDFELDDAERNHDCAIFYSGQLDRLFGYCYGELPWRSLRFETEKISIPDFQGCSVMNYADKTANYTRIHEFKHYYPENKTVMNSNKTIICTEYPADWKRGTEPYYPVVNENSSAIQQKYIDLLKSKYSNVILGGRLGAFKYFDIDKTIANAFETFNTYIKGNNDL